jgi:hypothetical protein
MKKKGRGRTVSRKRVTKKKECTSPVCPFWVFVLFISAWFAVAFLFVAIFYTSIRYPAKRLIPFAETNGGSTAMGVEIIPDEIINPQPEEGEGLAIDQPTVTIESCRPLEEVEDVYQMVLVRVRDYIVPIRQYGVWCRLNDGTEYVTYTVNARVPESERLYLEQVLSRVYRSDSESFVAPVGSFYCRTSPRGTPAEIVNAKANGVELRCMYQESGEEISRYLPIKSEGRIQNDGTDDARNNVGTREGTGDFARDYCVMRKDGNLCLLRNGDWILASIDHAKGDKLLVYRSDDPSELAGPTFQFLNHELKIIGTEGRYADVFYGWGSEVCQNESIIRVDVRTFKQEVLFHFTDCPSN